MTYEVIYEQSPSDWARELSYEFRSTLKLNGFLKFWKRDYQVVRVDLARMVKIVVDELVRILPAIA